MTSPPNPTLNSILVRSTNWVGDAILTTPVYRTLRQNHPKARIVVVARPWVAGVLEGNPNIDVLVVDDGKGFSNTRKVAAKARAANEGAPFDLGLSLPNSFGAALLLKLAGARRRVGFDLQLRRLLLTDPIAVPPWLLREHQVEYYLYLLRDICKDFTGVRELDFVLTAENQGAASGFLSAEKVTFEKAGSIIGIAPGAAFGTAKRWPAERYAALVAKLTSETGAHCLLIGSKTEADAAAEIMSWLSENAPGSLEKTTDTCGKLPLRTSAALIEKCGLFITNDSGAMHLAAALKRPIVAIFGPTDWVTTPPYSENAAIVRDPTECAPCLLRHCPIDHRCMTKISVEHVFEAALGQLESSSLTRAV